MKFDGYRKLELRELQLLQLAVMKDVHNACVSNGIKYYIISGSLLGAVRHGGFIPWDDDIDIAMMREDYELFKSAFDLIMDTNKYFLQHYDSDKDYAPALLRVCLKGTIQDLPSEAHLHNCKNTYIDIFPLDNVPDNESLRINQSRALKMIDNLIDLKLYHIYENNAKGVILAKRLIAALLLIIPLSILQKMRISEMTKYRYAQTKCVASTVSKYGYAKQVMDRAIYGNPALYQFEDTELYGVEKYDEYLTHLFGKEYMEIPSENKRAIAHDVYIKE